MTCSFKLAVANTRTIRPAFEPSDTQSPLEAIWHFKIPFCNSMTIEVMSAAYICGFSLYRCRVFAIRESKFYRDSRMRFWEYSFDSSLINVLAGQ